MFGLSVLDHVLQLAVAQCAKSYLSHCIEIHPDVRKNILVQYGLGKAPSKN